MKHILWHFGDIALYNLSTKPNKEGPNLEALSKRFFPSLGCFNRNFFCWNTYLFLTGHGDLASDVKVNSQQQQQQKDTGGILSVSHVSMVNLWKLPSGAFLKSQLISAETHFSRKYCLPTSLALTVCLCNVWKPHSFIAQKEIKLLPLFASCTLSFVASAWKKKAATLTQTCANNETVAHNIQKLVFELYGVLISIWSVMCFSIHAEARGVLWVFPRLQDIWN